MAYLKDLSVFTPQYLHRTEEGYLTGRIRVTCAGVFRYLGNKGEIIRVLRPEAEVGAPDSVASANSKPVTLQHPKDTVNSDNIQKYEVGFTGTDAEFDGLDLWVTITITAPKAIVAIEQGDVKAVSMGYDIKEMEINVNPENNWRGTEYTHIQHGIKYNHVALVFAGRAGESVEFSVADTFEDFINKKEDTMAKKSLLIDGAVYETDEAVADRIAGLEKQLSDKEAEYKTELDKVTAEKDAAIAEVKTLKENQKDEAEIARLVDEKINLIDTAKSYGCEIKAEDSILDIKKAVISKAFGDKMDLTDKSTDYVDCAFVYSKLHLDSLKEVKDEKSPLAPEFNKVNDLNDTDPELAYQKMCDSIKGKQTKKEA